MNRTNCPNCGAALPQFGGKCEFCGTRVVDLTMLDFDAREPTMFLLNLPQSMTCGQKAMISMWAHPELNSITMEQSYVSAYDGYHNELLRIPDALDVAFEVTLHPRADPNDLSLYKLKVDKEINL